MAKDDVSICNLALLRIGVSVKIDSLTQRTKEAIELNAVYEEVRDRVLAAAPWPFARKVRNLQLTGDTPVKWKYRYEYPNDCVAIRAIYPPDSGFLSGIYRQYLQADRTPYELENDDDGYLTICTDIEKPIIEYTARITNPQRFDAKFTSAFAWLLATEIALPLAKSIDYSRNAADAYTREINEAIAKALNEEKKDAPIDSEFVRARL